MIVIAFDNLFQRHSSMHKDGTRIQLFKNKKTAFLMTASSNGFKEAWHYEFTEEGSEIHMYYKETVNPEEPL